MEMCEGMEMAAIVSLRDIVKRYTRGAQRVTVLDGVDLEVESGEFLALMGPSGSGKTTLLNLIGGLDRADAGTITVSGRRIDTLSPSALTAWRAAHIGFVFQFYHLLPMLSAERNVEIPLLTTKLSRYERRRNARAALDLVGLIPRAEHRPAELSGGQQQRVAIARALVSDPKILVCDEPTGDLDRTTAEEILQLLQNLNEQLGTTIVMVTHDPLAAECASRVLQIDKGRLVHQERPMLRDFVGTERRSGERAHV
jgi:putative ABC transport system ATP-binding protein